MPWCPNCKTEYREGITHCADCKTELVADLKDVLLQNATVMLVKVDTENVYFMQKLTEFLEYSGVPCVVKKEGEMFGVYVTPEEIKKAKRIFKAFYTVETEAAMQRTAEAAFLAGEDYEDYFGEEDDESEDSEAATPSDNETEDKHMPQQNTASGNFVSAITRYEDYRSSGYTFSVIGIAGIIFAFLNFRGVITLFGSTYSSTILFLMFALFLGLGIFSFSKAEQLKEGAEQEKKLIEAVKEWMTQHITEETFSSLHSDGRYEDDSKTAELLYLDRMDQLVDRMLTAFPDMHASLAEQLIEEFCNQNFAE